jgi:hypothetical protein
MSQEFEYQVSINRGCIGTNSEPTKDVREAGKLYRESRKSLPHLGGGTVELKRRPVSPWETVEKAEV